MRLRTHQRPSLRWRSQSVARVPESDTRTSAIHRGTLADVHAPQSALDIAFAAACFCSAMMCPYTSLVMAMPE